MMIFEQLNTKYRLVQTRFNTVILRVADMNEFIPTIKNDRKKFYWAEQCRLQR